MRIPVPHLQQETTYTCLPACVRMVLAYLGDNQSEKSWRLHFKPLQVGARCQSRLRLLLQHGAIRCVGLKMQRFNQATYHGLHYSYENLYGC